MYGPPWATSVPSICVSSSVRLVWGGSNLPVGLFSVPVCVCLRECVFVCERVSGGEGNASVSLYPSPSVSRQESETPFLGNLSRESAHESEGVCWLMQMHTHTSTYVCTRIHTNSSRVSVLRIRHFLSPPKFWVYTRLGVGLYGRHDQPQPAALVPMAVWPGYGVGGMPSASSLLRSVSFSGSSHF